jgi:hypothetical protein
MPREVFKHPNVPESDEERTTREKGTITQSWEDATDYLVKRKVASPEEIDAARESFLASVDFKKLKDIFFDLYRRSGFSSESMNFVEPENIFLNGESRANGSYGGAENSIEIYPLNMLVRPGVDPEWWKEFAEARSREERNYGSVELAMVHTLIHEETHAVSRNIDITPDRPFTSAYKQSGFSRGANKKSRAWEEKDIPTFLDKPIAPDTHYHSQIFGLFNEGVIEKSARRVTNEYLAQTGWKQSDIAAYQENTAKNLKDLPYSEEIELVDLIIAKIAQTTGVPEETVFQALVRGLMEGEIFADKEVQELFRETFDDDFLRKLSKLFPNGLSKDRRAIDLINEYSRKPDLNS